MSPHSYDGMNSRYEEHLEQYHLKNNSEVSKPSLPSCQVKIKNFSFVGNCIVSRGARNGTMLSGMKGREESDSPKKLPNSTNFSPRNKKS
jgi:hypothetical protein